MSVPTIAPYFPFRRIKIIDQIVSDDACKARIRIKPDKRFQPVCHRCGHRASGAHSWTERRVRDLNLAATAVWIDCRYRKVFCGHCHRVSVEDLELFHPYLRVSSRLAHYIYQLCRLMTVADVARHLDLDWKTVKDIDKYYLERDYGQPNLNRLRILAVDEISIRKGHRYLTVVLDYRSGRVVYIGKDRKAAALQRFFDQLSDQQRESIKAVVMDMWDPFIKAVKKNCRMRKSCSTCSMWWPILTASSTRSATANTARPVSRIKTFTRAPGTCC
jgi:transposase